jgi:Mor family transcriptional regulator
MNVIHTTLDKIKIPQRYIPKSLKQKDKLKQKKNLKKSRKLYKKGVYFSRPKVDSFKSKESPHIKKLKKMYNIENIEIPELAKKTKCSEDALNKIIKKGQGAYFSSGSRPNQTAHSWGIARLGSSLTGGNASVVDYNELAEGCHPKSKPLILAKKQCKKVGRNCGKNNTRKNE